MAGLKCELMTIMMIIFRVKRNKMMENGCCRSSVAQGYFISHMLGNMWPSLEPSLALAYKLVTVLFKDNALVFLSGPGKVACKCTERLNSVIKTLESNKVASHKWHIKPLTTSSCAYDGMYSMHFKHIL